MDRLRFVIEASEAESMAKQSNFTSAHALMGCSVTPPLGSPPLLTHHHRQNLNLTAHLTRRCLLFSTHFSLALKPPLSYASPSFPHRPTPPLLISSSCTSSFVPLTSTPYPRPTRNPTYA
ncbi:peptidyl-prolyl cis-trans isomerase CYP28 [Pyrus ussuriensis x Pyrus communis]|uniref:Peptidyl-prolyl cis-trans isomerase CYP28 n=1 Tax=Pyrus ussuriensis x Pyrus communis TaxID=2448454 RepID=A0A5N5I750_9ROSA|nr:peptidyl-prolyl cis-trans isomerase CYP28 [Pyrus ussuriensis x Pyrus communis]